MSAPKPKKPARIPLNLRIGPAGRDSLDRIAAHRTVVTGKPVTRSDVAREAIADYCLRHDPEARRR